MVGIFQWTVQHPICQFFNDEENHYVTIDAEIGVFNSLHLVLVNPRQELTALIRMLLSAEKNQKMAKHITRMDGTIISGTFSGGSIKEGRFDIKYREKPEGGEAVY